MKIQRSLNLRSAFQLMVNPSLMHFPPIHRRTTRLPTAEWHIHARYFLSTRLLRKKTQE